MTENENDGNSKKKQKQLCNISQWHPSSALFFEKNSRHGDDVGLDRMVHYLAEMLRVLFWM